jgi:transglutaminase-like putative cysteine protease
VTVKNSYKLESNRVEVPFIEEQETDVSLLNNLIYIDNKNIIGKDNKVVKAADAMLVYKLNTGDTVNVYDVKDITSTTKPIAKAVVPAKQTQVLINIPAPKTVSDGKEVYVTLTRVGYKESIVKTAQDASAFTNIADLKILSLINPHSIDILQGSSFKLPYTIKANMNDGTIRDVSVTWNPATIDTTTAGSQSFIGTVEGTDSTVTLVVNVKSFNSTIESQQDFYNAIKYALTNFDSSIELKIKNYSNTAYPIDTIKKVIYENPDIDYGYSGSSSTYYSPDSSGYTRYILNFSYKLTKDEMNQEKAAVNAKVDSIISQVVTSGMTDYEKELALHNYVIKNADYDKRLPNEPQQSHNAYGVLVLGTGVCESYAKAMYVLLNKAGIDTGYVIGSANNGSGTQLHAWNVVKIGGEWYQLDATWDDPVVSGGASRIGYDYFNVTDSLISKNHVEDRTYVSYPACTTTTYNFFNMGGPEYDSNGNLMIFIKDQSELYNALKTVLDKRGTSISLVLMNYGTQNYNLSNTVNSIVNGQYRVTYSWKTSTNSLDSNIKYYEITFGY